MRFWLMAVVLLLAGLARASPQQEPANESGQEVATLTLRDLKGQPVSLESLRGRIVVLNFWATWCEPCREEMPVLEKLHAEYAARGISVIGASADRPETQRRIAPFLRKAKITFPIWTGATTVEMERMQLGIGLPATAVVDGDGQIAFRILGPIEEQHLRERLEWLLGHRAAPPPRAALDTFAAYKEKHKDDKHEEEEQHSHGGVGMEGASTVPS